MKTYRGLPIPSSPKLELFVQPNPSYGFMSENLTDAEIAANKAERLHEERLEQLEQDVVDAAILLRTINKPHTPAHAYSHAYDDLMNAVDALLRERKAE
jgi:hypothetical protein